ncbi:hypothetical protein MG293_002268 [Ovis ammon polii]|uniref:Uncharacterized protein n=1 Tax=Ovis ammon polii TaxID=230172 RepID=A0AAD4UNU6_OVIAM|nr:hypothetical protein MG293_002268 [Ovis ammon polii]
MLFGSAVRSEGCAGLGSRRAPTRLQHWSIATLTTTESPRQLDLSQRDEKWASSSDPFEYFSLRNQWIFVLGKIGNRQIKRTTFTMIKAAHCPRCGADVHTSPVPAGSHTEHLASGLAPLPRHAAGPCFCASGVARSAAGVQSACPALIRELDAKFAITSKVVRNFAEHVP